MKKTITLKQFIKMLKMLKLPHKTSYEKNIIAAYVEYINQLERLERLEKNQEIKKTIKNIINDILVFLTYLKPEIIEEMKKTKLKIIY